MSENEDKYHDTVLDLEAKLKKIVDLILKLGNSLQGMFMLGPKPLSVYDHQLKHGLGYPNPYTLKQAISQCPKLYLASSLGNSDISLNVRDTEDTLDDASKNFVPPKELSAEQKYFPSSFIPSDKNSNATPSIPASMPSESPLIIELDKIKNCFQRLSELIQKNCKRASIFYTSPEEIQLNDFCQDQLKPIVNELQFYFEFFKTLFQRDIKEMKDVFESTESELCELEKQNDFLKDQLLEVSLKHEVELSVLLNHECVDNSLHAEIEQLKKKSIEIQEGLQARIKILEKDVQRCEKQSVDFELKLQHEKEKHKWDSSFKNKNTNPLDYSWISKMEKLEDENVSLDFTVQSLIKERDNVKLEYQKLFNSIKKTRSQTQTEMDELIAHVSEKTYAYGAIRAENQNLLFTISELKTRLANVEKGKSVNTKFDKTNGSQPLLCVTPLHKHVIQKKMDVQKSEENHVVSKPVTLQTSPAKQRGVVQFVLWIVDSGCSKHMTGDRSLLKNFIEKFTGTVRFGNDNFAAITGYGDYIQGNITICHVYYVEGLGHNLFSVGQFCDGDLKVAFRFKICYVRNLDGDDLLTGGRESNLYTISISDMAPSSPVCLMSKATSTKSWLWHRRLSHLNFGTINDLTKLDLVDGLLNDHSKLELLHMDLCGPMWVASINGKKYILVIVDDYSRYTWVYFLHSKDETPEIIKKFIAQTQPNYKAKVCKIRTDNGTEFKNATLEDHYEKLGIMQQFSTARMP
ncbi:integrase, catalytic region, zinc finger, CCHC-type containing protein [Tanacetum coccineum]